MTKKKIVKAMALLPLRTLEEISDAWDQALSSSNRRNPTAGKLSGSTATGRQPPQSSAGDKHNEGKNTSLPLGTEHELAQNMDEKTDDAGSATTVKTGIDRLLEAAEKCGIPQSRRGIHPLDFFPLGGSTESYLKISLLRSAFTKPLADGRWQGLAAKDPMNVRIAWLIDNTDTQRLVDLAAGTHNDIFHGILSWAARPLFPNSWSMMSYVVVGSALGCLELAVTEDMERFAKTLGQHVVGGATAWGGALAGAAIGSVLGSKCSIAGSLIGSVYAGIKGQRIASRIPWLGGLTRQEFTAVNESITRRLTPSGVELNTNTKLSYKQTVEAILRDGRDSGWCHINVRLTQDMITDLNDFYTALLHLHAASPAEFAAFVGNLSA